MGAVLPRGMGRGLKRSLDSPMGEQSQPPPPPVQAPPTYKCMVFWVLGLPLDLLTCHEAFGLGAISRFASSLPLMGPHG